MGLLFTCLMWVLCMLCWQRKREDKGDDEDVYMARLMNPLKGAGEDEIDAAVEDILVPVFIPGKGTIMVPREERDPFAHLEGHWVVDGYLPAHIDRRGTT